MDSNIEDKKKNMDHMRDQCYTPETDTHYNCDGVWR